MRARHPPTEGKRGMGIAGVGAALRKGFYGKHLPRRQHVSYPGHNGTAGYLVAAIVQPGHHLLLLRTGGGRPTTTVTDQPQRKQGVRREGRRAHERTAQHSTAQHSTAQHSTAQHSTAQHSTAQHSTSTHQIVHGPQLSLGNGPKDFMGNVDVLAVLGVDKLVVAGQLVQQVSRGVQARLPKTHAPPAAPPNKHHH